MHTFQRTIVVGRLLHCLTIKMPILHGHCSHFKIKEFEALFRPSLLSGPINITPAHPKVNTFLVAHVFFAPTQTASSYLHTFAFSRQNTPKPEGKRPFLSLIPLVGTI